MNYTTNYARKMRAVFTILKSNGNILEGFAPNKKAIAPLTRLTIRIVLDQPHGLFSALAFQNPKAAHEVSAWDVPQSAADEDFVAVAFQVREMGFLMLLPNLRHARQIVEYGNPSGHAACPLRHP
jgi:hypothetical protein